MSESSNWSKLASETLELLRATKRLREAMRAKNVPAIREYAQQTSLWIAKLLSALPIAQQQESNLYLYRQALSAIFEAQQMSDLADKDPSNKIKLNRNLSSGQVKAALGSVLNGVDLNSVDMQTDKDWFQPIRLSGAIIAAPILLYTGHKLKGTILSHAISGIGVILALISMWSWNSHRKQLASAT